MEVAGLSGVVAVAGGSDHSLALLDDGTVWAWGSNSLGQLGDTSRTDSATALEVGGLAGVVELAVAGDLSLALLDDGSVWAWGSSNSHGQLGFDTWSPQPVPYPE